MEPFSALLALCAGNSTVTGEFPAQRPVTRSFDVFFDLQLNERLSKQSWGWWFEMPSRPLWCHSNGTRLDMNRSLVCCLHNGILLLNIKFQVGVHWQCWKKISINLWYELNQKWNFWQNHKRVMSPLSWQDFYLLQLGSFFIECSLQLQMNFHVPPTDNNSLCYSMLFPFYQGSNFETR